MTNPRKIRYLQLDDLIEETRKVIQHALDLLNKPMPDTFLGRHKQEPFPQEAQED